MLFLDAVLSVKYLFWQVLKKNGSFIFLFCIMGIVNNPPVSAEDEPLVDEGTYQTT